ncbi:MAG: protein-export membrane protein SecF [Porticoccaceae bacterium]|nr:MAG: protein-export membrane protein SecF [Porticoccaceae bacterium]
MEPFVINYMRWRWFATALSLLLVLASAASLALRGLELGLDFTGGTLVEVGFAEPVAVERVRARLVEAGFPDPVVAYFGSDREILVKFKGEAESDAGQRVAAALARLGGELEVKRVEFVGPQVGEELRDQGGLGVLVALLAVMLYVSLRFQYKFALGAVLALVHDVLVTLGVFSFFRLEFDLTVLAAVLAVIGYSLNDTIIVYDRIRENFRLIRETSAAAIINESLTQVLVRTVYTSLTTLLVLFSLFFFGGEAIHNFSLALIVGIGVGTYSSIYVASSLLLALDIKREDLVPALREGEEFEGLP